MPKCLADAAAHFVLQRRRKYEEESKELPNTQLFPYPSVCEPWSYREGQADLEVTLQS